MKNRKLNIYSLLLFLLLT